MKLAKSLLLLSILALGVFFRFYLLAEMPGGLNIDEVSEGYNAYSLLLTGKDRYGQVVPILFKSFGSFQAPLYTYLTIPFIKLMGLSIYAVRMVAAISGVLVVLLTYQITKEFKFNLWQGLITTLLMAIMPWGVLFSRFATEAILGLYFFVWAFLLLIKSVKKVWYLPFASLLFGISTHAYYSERIIAPLVLVTFLLIYGKFFIKNKKILLLALIFFGLTQVPHLITFNNGSLSTRFEQVTYLDENSFSQNGVKFHKLPLGRILYISREFFSQYSAYFSPRNLFSDPDPQGARSIPNLSVFYNWMIIPFLVGLKALFDRRKEMPTKAIFVLMFLAPIPAALSRDPFYTLRALELLWALSIVISFGAIKLIGYFQKKNLAILLSFFVVLASLFILYRNYFVLFKYERGEDFNYSSKKLAEVIEEREGDIFIIDLSRNLSIGLQVAFFRKFDPKEFQDEVGRKYLKNYSEADVYENEYVLDNVTIRALNWTKDIYKDQVLVSDKFGISEEQVREHKLKLEFEIKDLRGETVLLGYSTNPHEKCLSEQQKNVYCKGIL